MATNSTSNKEFPVKTLENQQKVSVAFIRLISTLEVLVIVTYGNISIKPVWREYIDKRRQIYKSGMHNSMSMQFLL